MRPVHIVLAVAVMAIWGLNFVIAKIGLMHLDPLMLTGSRFALVAAMLLPFVGRPRGQWGSIIVLSLVMGSLHFGFMFYGLRGIDASVASIAIQMQVPFAALLAAFFFKDYLGWRRLLGMAAAILGVVVLAGEPRFDGNLLPLGLVIAASLMWAFGNIVIKRMGPIDGFQLNAWLSLFTAPQLLLASWAFEPGAAIALVDAPWQAYAAILYMAVMVTIVGYGAWYFLIPRYEVNQTMPFTLLVPLFGVLSGVTMLDEALTWRVLVGGTAILAGVAVIIIRRPRMIAPEAQPDR
ncbi:MAG: EamA family transporter [Alphaproteobacteria bacterium]|nr:EamA family transporter [Alphaproteobacteria bacterium]